METNVRPARGRPRKASTKKKLRRELETLIEDVVGKSQAVAFKGVHEPEAAEVLELECQLAEAKLRQFLNELFTLVI